MSKESGGEPVKISVAVAALGVAAACISLAAAGLELVPRLLDNVPSEAADNADMEISEVLTGEASTVIVPTAIDTPTPPPLTDTPDPSPVGPLLLDNDFGTGFLGLSAENDGMCSLVIDGGAAVSSVAERAAAETRCSMVVSSQTAISLFNFAEAEMKAREGTFGTSAGHYWELVVNSAQRSMTWSAKCGMRWIEGVGYQQFMSVTSPNSTVVEYEQTVRSVAERWFSLRMEVDPATGQITCLSNDRAIGSHVPSAADELRAASDLVLRLTTVWETNSHGEFLTDNVYVGH